MRFSMMLAVLVACKGETAPPPVTETDETDAPGDTVEPLLDLTGQLGSIALMQVQPWAEDDAVGYFAAGVFVEDDGGIVNGAGCLLLGGLPCLTDLGAADEPATVADLATLTLTTFFAGDDVSVGGTSLGYQANGGFDLYFGQPAGWSTGDDLAFDGDLAPYSGTGHVTWAAPLVVTAPDPTTPVSVGPETLTVGLAWEAGGGGDLVVSVDDQAWHLTDDGAFDLPIEGAGLRAPFDQAFVVVSRLVSQDVDAGGNQVRVTTSSDQYLILDYLAADGWTALEDGVTTAEDCDAATSLTPIGAGQYWFDVSDADDDHDLGDSNDVTGYPSPGNDVVVPIQLADGDRLTVTARHVELDTSIYLLDAGCDEDDALDGVDDTLNGDEETFSYTANSDEVVYLVLDAYDDGDDGRVAVTIEINGD